MTSTATIPPIVTDTLPVAAPTPTRYPAPRGVLRLVRWVVALAVGVSAVAALPGIAFASTPPAGGDSDGVPALGPDPYLTSTSQASSSGRGLTTIVSVVAIAVLVAAVVVMAQRIARHRRAAEPTTARA